MGNIALNKTATASNSVMPYLPANAVNGTITALSRWLCNSVPAFLTVDTGALYLVNHWVVRHMPVAGWPSPDYANSDFKLQGSTNNSTWVDIDSLVGNTASITDRTITPVVFRYFRVYVSKGLRCNTQMASIMEFEVYQLFSTQLTNLTISAGTLTPVFIPNTLAYTATVNVDTINVTPTAQDPQAIVKINGVVAPSGQPKSVNLVFGLNTITVNVTAGDGTQSNYTIAVTRQGSASLKTLIAQDNLGNVVPLNPSFSMANLTYTAKTDYDASAIAYIPTTEDPLATIKLDGTSTPNGSISGATVVGTGITSSLEVTSTSGNKKTYTVVVSKNTSAYLTNFQVKKGSASQPFTPNFTRNNLGAYSLNVGTSTSVTIWITKEDLNATAVVTSNGTPLTLSGSSYPLSMPVAGTYAIVVTVTSTTGAIKTYTLNITRN